MSRFLRRWLACLYYNSEKKKRVNEKDISWSVPYLARPLSHDNGLFECIIVLLNVFDEPSTGEIVVVNGLQVNL